MISWQRGIRHFSSRKVVVANCGGFLGDDPDAALRQVTHGKIDYLVCDYLAEVTMAILQKQKEKDPAAGYAKDFLRSLKQVLPTCVEKNIKIIANAGGVNPWECKKEVEKLAQSLGVPLSALKIVIVEGDNVFPQLSALSGELQNMDSGEPLGDPSRFISANVYLGAPPIVTALERGANIVITGRVTDTSLTLAPFAYEFGWNLQKDMDLMASGIVAGHIIECGAQCTGGNFTDWQKVESHTNMGFPLCEMSEDGSFVISKHEGTGGLVSIDTVREQLMYELGHPAYLSPDCVARFDSIRLEDVGKNRVKVTGVRGQAPPEKLKVSMSFLNGYRAFGRLMVSGPDALKKAQFVAQNFWQTIGKDFAECRTQFIGHDACHPNPEAPEPSEILLQVAVRDQEKGKISTKFAPHLVPKVLATVPGITYLSDQGRPRPTEVVGYWPALVSRRTVKALVHDGDQTVGVSSEYSAYSTPQEWDESFLEVEPRDKVVMSTETRKVRLLEVALARSGDKGDTSNIGVMARSQAAYDWIDTHITADFVKSVFPGVCLGEVERHAVPNLMAHNFLLHESLGGGGTKSLLLDSQGKTYAQALLRTMHQVPLNVLESIA